MVKKYPVGYRAAARKHSMSDGRQAGLVGEIIPPKPRPRNTGIGSHWPTGAPGGGNSWGYGGPVIEGGWADPADKSKFRFRWPSLDNLPWKMRARMEGDWRFRNRMNGTVIDLHSNEWKAMNRRRKLAMALRIGRWMARGLGKNLASFLAEQLMDALEAFDAAQAGIPNTWAGWGLQGWEQVTYGDISSVGNPGGGISYDPAVADGRVEPTTNGLYQPGQWHYKWSGQIWNPTPSKVPKPYYAAIASQAIAGTSPGAMQAGLWQQQTPTYPSSPGSARFRHAASWVMPSGKSLPAIFGPLSYINPNAGIGPKFDSQPAGGGTGPRALRPVRLAQKDPWEPFPQKKKDSKHVFRSRGAALALGLVNGVTEGLDLLNVLYEALPWWIKKQPGQLPQDKLARILANFHLINWNEALLGLLWNQLEDGFWGGIGGALGKAAREQGKLMGWGTGPWDTPERPWIDWN